MSPVEIIGWLAALASTVLGLPQAIRLIRTRQVDGLSLVAWQAMLAINLGWTSHGILLGRWNMILPNALALTSTLPVLYLMAAHLGLTWWRVLLPGLAGAALMAGLDLAFGSLAYGVIAVVPAVIANVGQSMELVRAPQIVGVSPIFLAANVANQALWLGWALLVSDAGTGIAAFSTGLLALFNLTWWVLRRFGLRPRFGGADEPVVAEDPA